MKTNVTVLKVKNKVFQDILAGERVVELGKNSDFWNISWTRIINKRYPDQWMQVRFHPVKILSKGKATYEIHIHEITTPCTEHIKY